MNIPIPIRGALYTLLPALTLMSAGTAVAQEQEYQPQVESKTHIEEALPGDDDKTVIIREFDFPPGHEGGRHYHPGAVYVYVLEGEFTIDVEGREAKTLTAGDFFKEPLGRNMSARNGSKDENARVLVFQVGDTGEPMMIEVGQ